MGYDGSRQQVAQQTRATLAVIALFFGACVMLGVVGALVAAGVHALG